ncbi:hypothetical protein BJ875DRAFT_468556 [Amylocarpus encephaloides]|uniref:DUF7580 domain-containing protein n=1 Tax=Amylocarpus encephaloides TaxID=45428 RepID=A0A9P7YEX7_9HELO|nr:hypothetical protein BJ875DRAFT_468556 [Amylocarpus encephaloides]
MSGFEVVGVMLGGLPLIISTAERYRKGSEPFLKWRRFRTEFRTFINNVDLEKQMFDAIANRLLQQTDLPAERKDALLTGHEPDGWYQTEVQESFKRRLAASYDVFLYLLEAIGEDYIQLEAMMSLKDGSVEWANPDEDQWNYQRKRISHSFNKKGTVTVASLGDKNRKLRDLLDALDLGASPRHYNERTTTTSKDTTWARIFDCIRCQAGSLHLALKNGWKCGCEMPHLTALQLQTRASGGWTSQFIMAFSSKSHQQKTLDAEKKLMITVKQSQVIDPSMATRPQPKPLQDANVTKINLLRAKFDTKHSHQVFASSQSLPSLESPVQNLGLGGTAGSAFYTIAQVTSGPSKTSISELWRSKKPKKSVRIVAPLPVGVQKDGTIITPIETVSQLSPSHLEISAGERSGIETKNEDLCSTLETSCPRLSCLGYLPDGEDRHHQLRSLRSSVPLSTSYVLINLEKLLDHGTRPSLTRKQRFRLAVTLASSLLQLQTTPWLTEKLEKKDIFFEYCGRDVDAEHPYIYHFFPSSTSPSATPSKLDTSKNKNGLRDKNKPQASWYPSFTIVFWSSNREPNRHQR